MLVQTATPYLIGGSHQGKPGLHKQGFDLQSVHIWRTVGYQDDAEMARSALRAVEKFDCDRVVFALDAQRGKESGAALTESIRLMKPARRYVKLLEIADEAKWDKEKIKTKCEQLRAIVRREWPDVPVPPIGMMLTPDQIRGEEPGFYEILPASAGGKGPEVWGIELYCNRKANLDGIGFGPWDMGRKRNRAYITETWNLFWQKVHPACRASIAFQAFGRNGRFLTKEELLREKSDPYYAGEVNEQSIVDICEDGLNLVKNDSRFGPRVDHLWPFNYGRVVNLREPDEDWGIYNWPVLMDFWRKEFAKVTLA